jgi:hypothetical protein
MKTALLEAYTVTIGYIPVNLRNQCILVGGAALAIIGRGQSTKDVDFAISAEALHAFFEGASGDARFKQNLDGGWTYTCQTNGINVDVEFLEAGGEFAPTLKTYNAVGDGYCAGLAELGCMKAAAVCGRGTGRDREDLEWILTRMLESGESFR